MKMCRHCCHYKSHPTMKDDYGRRLDELRKRLRVGGEASEEQCDG